MKRRNSRWWWVFRIGSEGEQFGGCFGGGCQPSSQAKELVKEEARCCCGVVGFFKKKRRRRNKYVKGKKRERTLV